MSIKHLVRILNGDRKNKVDSLKGRLRNLENDLTKMMTHINRNQGNNGKGNQKDRKRTDRARSVYTSGGWKISDRETDLNMVNFDDEWMLEFECPNCGNVSHRGVNHSHTRGNQNHTEYGIYLNCRSCGWRSNLLNIRAFR